MEALVSITAQDTEKVEFKVPPRFSLQQIGVYLRHYPSCMLDIRIIYCKEIKDIGEWHRVWIGPLHSSERAAGGPLAFDLGGYGRKGMTNHAIYHNEKRSKTAIKKRYK